MSEQVLRMRSALMYSEVPGDMHNMCITMHCLSAHLQHTKSCAGRTCAAPGLSCVWQTQTSPHPTAQGTSPSAGEHLPSRRVGWPAALGPLLVAASALDLAPPGQERSPALSSLLVEQAHVAALEQMQHWSHACSRGACSLNGTWHITMQQSVLCQSSASPLREALDLVQAARQTHPVGCRAGPPGKGTRVAGPAPLCSSAHSKICLKKIIRQGSIRLGTVTSLLSSLAWAHNTAAVSMPCA